MPVSKKKLFRDCWMTLTVYQLFYSMISKRSSTLPFVNNNFVLSFIICNPYAQIMVITLTARFGKLMFLPTKYLLTKSWKTLLVRDEILRGLMNSDLIGFHTFDYFHHFLSCCNRMLGLDYESKRGHIGLDYFGRTIFIKIFPVGIHMGKLESVLNLSFTSGKLKEVQEEFKSEKVILCVEDMDILKGLSLKLLAVEQLLQQNPDLQGKVVLVQIVNTTRGSGKDVQEVKKETYLISKRINDTYSLDHYQLVILIDRPILTLRRVPIML
ncbi:hypothetical protein VNO77_27696 [Canavalia gladiata]|uniref:Uncharacterized protein n=1 Tax=Canavalia gladiata TaxID=3824 RepID=A0AAN9Q6Q8_CANGL